MHITKTIENPIKFLPRHKNWEKNWSKCYKNHLKVAIAIDFYGLPSASASASALDSDIDSVFKFDWNRMLEMEMEMKQNKTKWNDLISKRVVHILWSISL